MEEFKSILIASLLSLGIIAISKLYLNIKKLSKLIKERKYLKNKYCVGSIIEYDTRPWTENPFRDKEELDIIRVQILDIKNNKAGEKWVKYKYLSKNMFFTDKYDNKPIESTNAFKDSYNEVPDNKTIFSEKLNDFMKRFKD